MLIKEEKMNNGSENKNKPNGSPAKLIAAIAAALLVLGEASGFNAAVGIFSALFIGIITFFVVISVQKKRGESSGNGTSENNTGAANNANQKREFKPQHFDMSKFTGKAGEGSLSKRLTEKMREDFSRCDDDHEHVEPSINASADEKRASQLKEMLRNGIIEKEEYNILMRKFGIK